MKILFILSFILTACSQKFSVDSIKVTQGFVESTVTTINSGTVEAKKQAELSFGTVGRISVIHTNVGSIVKEGTIIAEIENQDLKAVYEEANKEFERAKELFNNGLVSVSNLDSAKRAKEVSRINLEKTIIKAPFTGMITALDLKVGEFYQTATTLSNRPKVQMIDLDKRLVKGEIDEVDLNKVKNGQLARVKIPALKRTINARVNKVVPFVSTAKDQDRTSQLELELITEKDLKITDIPVGASADVEIVTEKKENVTIIPTNYIQGVGTKKFVYKLTDNKLHKVTIKIGTGNYDRSEIIEGLNINDTIARPPEGIDDVEKIKVEAKEIKWP